VGVFGGFLITAFYLLIKAKRDTKRGADKKTSRAWKEKTQQGVMVENIQKK